MMRSAIATSEFSTNLSSAERVSSIVVVQKPGDAVGLWQVRTIRQSRKPAKGAVRGDEDVDARTRVHDLLDPGETVESMCAGSALADFPQLNRRTRSVDEFGAFCLGSDAAS